MELHQKIHLLSMKATIVFDAHHQPGLGRRSFLEALEVCYTDEGETADLYILKQLKALQNPKQVTVVTSDKKLAREARMLSAKSQTVEQFISFLAKQCEKKLPKREEALRNDPLPPLCIRSEEYASVEKIAFPGVEKSAEESFEYYLQEFEKDYRKLQKFFKLSEKPPAESDMKRWRRIFESRDQK